MVVSDMDNNTLTSISGGTGEVISRLTLNIHMVPGPFTCDNFGKIYVCFIKTCEVAVFANDFSAMRTILNEADGLCKRTLAIAYDSNVNRITLSYGIFDDFNLTDCFIFS